MDRDDNPDRPPTAEEQAAAEALREGLEGRRGDDAADFARALSLAHAPRPIADADHRAIVERALFAGDARRAAVRRRRTRSVVVVATAVALAASVALFVRAPVNEDAPTLASFEPLVPVRSTQPLFREPFARAGGESARIDRIASARAADLRDNRFAAWGVR